MAEIQDNRVKALAMIAVANRVAVTHAIGEEDAEKEGQGLLWAFLLGVQAHRRHSEWAEWLADGAMSGVSSIDGLVDYYVQFYAKPAE